MNVDTIDVYLFNLYENYNIHKFKSTISYDINIIKLITNCISTIYQFLF